MKNKLVETTITKNEDNPLLKSIKEYFKKEKEISLVNYESSGDIVTIDLRFKLDIGEVSNDPTKRVEGRQQAYDVKRKLEEYLFKEFNISVLSIQGLIIKQDYVEFEISFVYKNVGNFKVEYQESNSFINRHGQILRENCTCYYNNIPSKVIRITDTSLVVEIAGKKKVGSKFFFEDKLKLNLKSSNKS